MKVVKKFVLFEVTIIMILLNGVILSLFAVIIFLSRYNTIQDVMEMIK